ncbi:MAG: GyrI-like domain-containing protein [Chloroflexota bacterium]
MEKLDLKKDLKYLYAPSAKKIEVVEVPAFNFIMADGAIEPGHEPGNSPMFKENMQALYGAAYTLKFMAKLRKENPVDYPVMALEGLWDVTDGIFDIDVKDNLIYTVMILVPDLVMPEMFAEALAQMRKKKGDQPGFDRLRLEGFHEGLCVQTMHIGPYATEPATVARMEAFAQENGYEFCHDHHEIYIGNPLRADPSKLKTVLRHPVKRIQ